MPRVLIVIISILYSCLALAKPAYQIDLIVFAQNTAAEPNNGSANDTLLIPQNSNTITLKASVEKTIKPYCLLSNTRSGLQDEYYQLSRKSHHQVLGHYSWQQPMNNQSTVSLPLVDRNGWQMQGTFNVISGNYYTFNANLQASAPNNPQSAFTVSQKQRLKENVVYYLDNEQLGMIVKIHKVA